MLLLSTYNSAKASTWKHLCEGTASHHKIFKIDKSWKETWWKCVKLIVKTSQVKSFYCVDRPVIKLRIA